MGSTRFGDIVRGTGAPRGPDRGPAQDARAAGVIGRTAYQQRPERFDYHLTESGEDLVSVLDALLAWGDKHVVAADDPDGKSYRRIGR